MIFIKTAKTFLTFGMGVGATLLYQKYSKDITNALCALKNSKIDIEIK